MMGLIGGAMEVTCFQVGISVVNALPCNLNENNVVGYVLTFQTGSLSTTGKMPVSKNSHSL